MIVGEKVKTTRALWSGEIKRGGTGTIIRIDDEDFELPYLVQFDDVFGDSWVSANDIVPADVTTINYPPKGMTSAQLADAFESFINQARSRVLGAGDEQYSTPKGQQFEDMSPLRIVRMAREEAQDGAVYMAMLDVRLSRLEAALVEAFGG